MQKCSRYLHVDLWEVWLSSGAAMSWQSAVSVTLDSGYILYLLYIFICGFMRGVMSSGSAMSWQSAVSVTLDSGYACDICDICDIFLWYLWYLHEDLWEVWLSSGSAMSWQSAVSVTLDSGYGRSHRTSYLSLKPPLLSHSVNTDICWAGLWYSK